jgi:IMP dehydrogenase
MDGVVSPATAIEIGRLGGLGVLNLEGLWTRYEDPEPLLEEIAELDADKATADAGDLRRADQARADHRQRIARRSRRPASSRRLVTPQRTEQFTKASSTPSSTCSSSRARRVRRARVEDGRAAQPQALHPRARRSR